MSNQLAILPLYLAWHSIGQQDLGGVADISARQKWQTFTNLVMGLPEGYTVFRNVGVAYKLYDEEAGKRWNDARKYCIGEGAHLAVIDSVQKAGYVRDLEKMKTNVGIYTGIHRLFDGKEWLDVRTGLSPAMIPWADSTDDYGKKCCTVDKESTVSQADCNEFYYFACEIRI